MSVRLFLFALILACSPVGLSAQKKLDLFVLIGQSNMAGRAPVLTQDTLPLPNVLLVNRELELEPATNPLNRYSTIRKDDLSMQRLGPGYHFGKKLTQHIQDTVALLVNARGGTAIDQWLKGSEYAYYEAVVNRTRRALEKNRKLRLKAVLWHQGESDRLQSSLYLSKLKLFIADFREDVEDPYLPFLIGELGPWNEEYVQIRKKQRQAIDSIENSYLVVSDGLNGQDHAHFDTFSQRILGERFAAEWIKVKDQLK